MLHSKNPQHSQLAAMRPSLLRSLFTVGLICKQFDVDTITPQSTQVGTLYSAVCDKEKLVIYMYTVHPQLSEPELSDTSIIRMQNFTSHTHITKATRVLAIAKSCKMAFSHRQKQCRVQKMY